MEKLASHKMLINNDFYETLHDGWYEADDHPIALLRAENALRSVWIYNEIKDRVQEPVKLLDVGCGAGFLTNNLALKGYNITGLDLSQNSLAVAKKYDKSGTVNYIHGNAYNLPFEDASFNVVCATDILEHVEDPDKLISEVSRVLKPNGLFFFHTFNRNFLSYLIVIKGVDWFVKNAPKNIHVYHLFITPKELTQKCKTEKLYVDKITGFAPKVTSLAFWKMLMTRKVPKDLSFTFTRTLSTGYCGIAIRL